jgi:zinc transporter ZupT
MTDSVQTTISPRRIPLWISALIPLVALGLMLSIFAFGDPLSLFKVGLPPVEEVSFERVRLTNQGFEVELVNGGPDPVTVAQVLVDEAYWEFRVEPSAVIPRLGRASLQIPYPWVEGELHGITVLTNTGATFATEVPIAVETPSAGMNEFLAYGLLGIYVGIIPVGLGMLWFPAMRRLDRKWLGAILALTIGLLVFLLIDTLLEAFEFASELPGVFQGIPLTLFAALLTWLVLQAVGSTRKGDVGEDPTRRRLYLATLIALGIGLHNLGEGMAIGAAFAIGEAALGSFLVIGFTVHNITEGVGIAAPLLPVSSKSDEGEATQARSQPAIKHFVLLTLLAGTPAIFGAWMGGFAFSPFLATLFLGIGIGAIWQVIVDVTRLLRTYAEREKMSLTSWYNVAGFTLGLAFMYITAFLVKF